MISKNELKRRIKPKTKVKAMKKAEKAQEAKAIHPKASSIQEQDEDDLDPNEYYEICLNIIAKVENESEFNTYPHNSTLQVLYPCLYLNSPLQDAEILMERLVTITGRINSKGSSGAKQIFYGKKTIKRLYHVLAYNFESINSLIRCGDIVGIFGYSGRTKKSEFSIIPIKITFLSPCAIEYFPVLGMG